MLLLRQRTNARATAVARNDVRRENKSDSQQVYHSQANLVQQHLREQKNPKLARKPSKPQRPFPQLLSGAVVLTSCSALRPPRAQQ